LRANHGPRISATAFCALNAADPLYDRVLPFYEALELPVGAVLTDNGRDICGPEDQHHYELLLALEDIQHLTTGAARLAPMVWSIG